VYYIYTREFCVKIILIGTKKRRIAHISKRLFSSAKYEGFYAFKRDNNFHKEIAALSHLSHNNLFCFLISVVFDKALEDYFASIIFSSENCTERFAFMYSYVLFEYLLSLILNSKSILYTPLLKIIVGVIHIEVVTCSEIFIH